MKWFKFYGQDWLTDLKVMRMSVVDRLCFITLLCLASSGDNGGVIKNCDENSLIELTHLSDENYDNAKGCLNRYKALQSVTINDNGDVTVLNFSWRQSENLSNAERQKKYRERHKMPINKVIVNVIKSNNSNIKHNNDRNARLDKNRLDKNSKEEPEAELPNWLNKTVWEEWIEYRKQIKKKLTPITIKKQLRFLFQNVKDHPRIIEISISNGWTGLFPIKRGFEKLPNRVHPSSPEAKALARKFIIKDDRAIEE